MEKKARQRKPYNRVWCKLTDYTQEATMFAISGGDKDGISNFTEAAYESAKRMKAYGDANGGPNAHTSLGGGRTLDFNVAYYYDPLIGTYAPPIGGYVGSYDVSYMPGCHYQYLPMGAWVYDGGTSYYIWGREWGKSGGTQGLPLTSLRAFADGLGCGSSPGLFGSYGYGGDSCGYCC